MQTKNFNSKLSLKQLDDDGVFKGYGSIFDVVDSQFDVIEKGAFDRTINEKGADNIKFLWQHNPSEPIGILKEIKEDEKGLFIEGQLLLDLQRGKEAHTLLKSGAIDGLSIGYSAIEFDINSKTGVRNLKEVDLWEISLVTFPANEEAGVTSVKNEIPRTIREFENFLRDAGFSRSHAKSIAGGGFKPDDSEQREADEIKRVSSSINNAINILKEKSNELRTNQ